MHAAGTSYPRASLPAAAASPRSLTRGLPAWLQKREHNQPLFGLEDFAEEDVEAKKRQVEVVLLSSCPPLFTSVRA